MEPAGTRPSEPTVRWRQPEPSERPLSESELRESERRYRTLFEAIDEGFCVIEVLFDSEDQPEDYRFLEANPAFERHTGLVDAVGRTARELLPDLERHWIEIYGRVALTGEPARFESGSEVMGRWFDVYAFPIDPPEDRKVALLFEDVTEKRESAEALREAKRAAEEASRTKGRLLAVMSHELRTPLTGVIGFADLLESEVPGPLTARQREALSQIKASSWHLVGIIDEILTLSRVEAGKEAVHWEESDLGGIVREVVRTVQPQAVERGLLLHTEGADEPLPARLDRGKVRRVLTNLVGNALKYTPEGEVAVEVDRSSSDWLQVHVRDTGPGIASEDRERIFEPFAQGDNASDNDGSGTGLGLSICRKLAELMDGQVTLETSPGEGSTFTLHLPRRPGP